MGTPKSVKVRKPAIGLTWSPKYRGKICQPTSVQVLNQTVAEFQQSVFVTNQDFSASLFYEDKQGDWLELYNKDELCSLSAKEAFARLTTGNQNLLFISHPESEMVNRLWLETYKPQPRPTHRLLQKLFNGQAQLKSWELIALEPFDPFDL